MKKVGKIVSLVVVLLFVIVLLANSFATVPVGATGIMLTLGRVEDAALSEGIHFKIPFAQRIISVDNRVKKLEMSTEAFSKDIQTVSATLAVNYRLQTDKTFSIYKTTGLLYEENIVIPATHEVLKSVCAQYTAEELISKRAESSDKMRDELDAKLDEIGITITDFNIIDFDFSDEFISAVESKQVAEQLKKKAATENETAIAQAEREKQVTIKQSEAEAERMRLEAEAKAKSVLIAAEAQAEATKLSADAESYRLEAISKYITPGVIQMELTNKWDGKLPTIAGSGMTGIMDVSDLMDDPETDEVEADAQK